MATEKQIEAYIQGQQSNVKVDSYHDVVMGRGYVERVCGIVAGAFLGIVTGALLGAALGVVPWLAGAAAELTWLSVAHTMAAVGGVGLVAGSTAGGIYAGSSGSVAAAMEEMERRQKQDTLKQNLLKDPELHKKAEAYAKDPSPAKPAGATTLKEARQQSRNGRDFFKQVYDVRMGVIFGILGAIAGAVLGAGLLPGEAITGLPFVKEAGVALASKVIAGASLVGLIGLTVGVNYSILFTSTVNLVKNMASGEFFRKKQPPAVEQAPVTTRDTQTMAAFPEAAQAKQSFVEKLATTTAEQQRHVSP